MICKVGDVITIPVNVQILAPFAHNDRVYYVAKTIKNNYTSSVWVVSTDGELLEITEEILEKAGKALSKLS